MSECKEHIDNPEIEYESETIVFKIPKKLRDSECESEAIAFWRDSE